MSVALGPPEVQWYNPGGRATASRLVRESRTRTPQRSRGTCPQPTSQTRRVLDVMRTLRLQVHCVSVRTKRVHHLSSFRQYTDLTHFRRSHEAGSHSHPGWSHSAAPPVHMNGALGPRWSLSWVSQLRFGALFRSCSSHPTVSTLSSLPSRPSPLYQQQQQQQQQSGSVSTSKAVLLSWRRRPWSTTHDRVCNRKTLATHVTHL
jgi:hypothetical protein